jgi:hypothetical protein
VVVREKPYFEKTYFLTLKKLISLLSENLFPYKHKYPTDGSELEHIKLRINKFLTHSLMKLKHSLKFKPFPKYLKH